MTTERREQLLQEAYKLERWIRRDPMAKKIYSDVRVYSLIAELEDCIAKENDYFRTLSAGEVEKVERIFG